MLTSTTYLFLSYKKLGIKYDEKEIQYLIKETDNIDYELNYRIYKLLEDISYLESAYTQCQKIANKMEDELKTKFITYPIPKSIINEWGKIVK